MESTTQTQSTEFYTETIGRSHFVNNLKTYFLNPLSFGIAGFAAFFSLILFTNLFNYIFGISVSFSIEMNDVVMSLTGFVFAAGAKFLEFFSKEEN